MSVAARLTVCLTLAGCEGSSTRDLVDEVASAVADRECPNADRPLLSNIVQIEGSGMNTCAVDGDGAVLCWGAKVLSFEAANSSPWKVEGLPPVRDVKVSFRYEAITQEGEIFVWGRSVAPHYGTVPNPRCGEPRLHCTDFAEIADPSLDPHLAAALHPDQVELIEPDFGRVQSRNTKRALPTRLPRTRARFLPSGGLVDAAGHFQCDNGPCGRCGFARRIAEATGGTKTSLFDQSGVALENDVPGVCLVFRDGLVECGAVSCDGVEAPPMVSSFRLPSPVRAASTMEIPATYLLEDGQVATWGTELRPRLSKPVPGLVAIDGDFYMCGVRDNGRVVCWGKPNEGGIHADYPPERIVGVEGAVDVAAGAFSGCALLGDGHVRCWGLNGDGQLGHGTTGDAVEWACPVIAPRSQE